MKLLILSAKESQLSRMLGELCEVKLCPAAADVNLAGFDAVAVLGGTQEGGVVLPARLRERLEAFAGPVFLEFVSSFRHMYSASPMQISHHRLVWEGEAQEGLLSGDLLDSHYNNYRKPHCMDPEAKVLLRYRDYVAAHDHVQADGSGDPALWVEDNVLACMFRMCDYAAGAFAPRARWDALAAYICRFLTGKEPQNYPPAPYRLAGQQTIPSAVEKGLSCLESYLIDGGENGILEGLSHNIRPDGARIAAGSVRTDCCGEAAGAFLFSGKEELRKKGEALYRLCYGPLQVKGGQFDGMLRWTEEAWEVCYQDDVARAILPGLVYARMGMGDGYVAPAKKALDFLADITCKDGLLPFRTDVIHFLDKDVRSQAQQPHGYASAHYNAWHFAALLLCAMETGDGRLMDAGIRGMESLMAAYPETAREHSETSEMCKLIFPLAALYEATGEKKHREWLDRVFADLMTHSHPAGGFAEWDTGYRAHRFNTAGDECSLLSQNGDPVCDLLYSLNWLPLGFAWAWKVTGDRRFREAWQNICAFMASAQLESEDPRLNGAWCRGLDMSRMEYYGIPHDVGWGPCCVETGWTVAEILMGMEIGLILEKRGA